jgi:hypothetical protein
MKTRRLRTVVGMLSWVLSLGLAGCHSAQQAAPAEVTAAPQNADVVDEARRVAEAALGKQAEILARGNLAPNGREQLLVVNRFSTGTAAGTGSTNPSPILVTRAAILEKNGDKWSEVLLCDEHLKNPDGYLGGSPVARITGWRLAYNQDTKEGLEMKFTPAERSDDSNVNSDQSSGQTYPTLDVRWNGSAKRYQSFDQSHERYLSEVPSLETPQSILK